MELFLALIAVGGTLLGTLGGAYLNHYLESKRHNSVVLFESRKNVYAKFLGLGRNVILNSYTTEEVKEFERAAAEAILLSGDDLSLEIAEFANEFIKYKDALPFHGRLPGEISNLLKVKLKKLDKTLKKELKIT